MAGLALGTGATLRSQTIEAAIHELATYCKMRERVALENPNNQENFRLSWDSVLLQYSCTFSLPCTYNREGNNFVPKTINYFSNLTYNSGTGGDLFGANNPLQDFMNLILEGQRREADTALNPTGVDYLRGELLNEPYRFEGSYRFDTTEIIAATTATNSATAGDVIYRVRAYLN